MKNCVVSLLLLMALLASSRQLGNVAFKQDILSSTYHHRCNKETCPKQQCGLSQRELQVLVFCSGSLMSLPVTGNRLPSLLSAPYPLGF